MGPGYCEKILLPRGDSARKYHSCDPGFIGGGRCSTYINTVLSLLEYDLNTLYKTNQIGQMEKAWEIGKHSWPQEYFMRRIQFFLEQILKSEYSTIQALEYVLWNTHS